MGDFTLDTSGVVLVVADPGYEALQEIGWSDLDPLTQGYVEAAFASFPPPHFGCEIIPLGFSDLAPETLEAIRKDCAARVRHHPTSSLAHGLITPQRSGWLFWKWRQEGRCKNFPPLTITLGDDGKVYLGKAA